MRFPAYEVAGLQEGRLGIGRLPGDFNFRLFGREWSIPLMSTIVLSLAAALIARLF